MATSDNISTVGTFLHWATQSLTEAHIPTARLDCLIIMEDTLGQDRARLLAYPELPISDLQLHKLNKLIEQRRLHIPVAYLRGMAMFYGRSFYVTRDVLIPRPESEDMITLLKTYSPNGSNPAVADIGSGSGCLGLTAALELKCRTVDLYDIDADTLTVAKINAHLLNVSSARYLQEDLLSKALLRKYDVILANLPYVPDDYPINQDAEFEPELALFAGPDGLNDYRKFWSQIKSFASKPRYILTESQPETQHELLIPLANEAGYESKETLGFIQLFSLA